MSNDDEELKPFQIRVSDRWLEMVDDFRRKQRPKIPPQSEAIRRLVTIGYEADKAGFVLPPPKKPPMKRGPAT